MTVHALPEPTTERWQPLRLGLVDLFYYDDEQFWFHDGRLLLRGNNGTGKSKVLALTLPFLLDGDFSARRVEPDADPKKRMEWNLLLGGAHGSAERTGYAWIEFGRRDSDGRTHFTTLAIGMKAAAGRGIVKKWFLTASRRVGELRLVDENRLVLTAERLSDEIGVDGTVHRTREAYRRAVDEALFALGEERYAALIDLLIQLRQPQLSKRPDERLLSAALTEALAPLGQAVVNDVAESFRSLEEERDQIAAARDTLRAAETFLLDYRAYARVTTRRHASGVRLKHSAYEHAGRDLGKAQTALADVTDELAGLRTAEGAAEMRQSALQGEKSALQASPAMRDAQGLQHAERSAVEAEDTAADAESEAAEAVVASDREDGVARAAASHVEHAAGTAHEQETKAAQAADAAGLADQHGAILNDREVADRALRRRRDQIRHVRELAAGARAARRDADGARRHLDEAEGSAVARADAVQHSYASVEAAVAEYRAQTADYVRGLTHLRLSDVAVLPERAEEWARSQAGDSPVRTAIAEAVASATDAMARERADAEQRQSEAAERLHRIDAEIAELEAGRDPAPPTGPGRDPAVREQAAGAPLWQVVDFAAALTEAERAGLEAALQSAGLLDAWLFPDGTVSAAGDVVLGPAHEPVETPVLGAALITAIGPESDLSDAVVDAVLARIGIGEAGGAALWCDLDGRWGAGPARGTWHKERAEYVGAGAREAHRTVLLTAWRTERAEVQATQADAEQRVAKAEAQQRAIAAERNRLPESAERRVAGAHSALAHADHELAAAEGRVAAVRALWEQAEAVAETQQRELSQTAADLRTGSTDEELEAAVQAVAQYDKQLTETWAARRAVADATVAHEQATRRARAAAHRAAATQERARVRRGVATTLRAAAERLRETVGASVAELQRQLNEVETGLLAAKADQRRLAGEINDASGRHGGLTERVADLEERRREADVARTEAASALRVFAETGLLRVALPEMKAADPSRAEEWTITPAVALARTIQGDLVDIDEDDAAWASVQDRLSRGFTELQGQMSRRGHTAILEQRGEVSVVRVHYRLDEIAVDRLAARLSADLEARERLLSARERAILENHLVNEVAGDLHDLLQRAEAQIGQMNTELSTRRTSTGMQLRVRWKERVDGPAGLVDARRLMLRSDATWTPEDRTAIGDFLQARINEVRDENPAGSWVEHLEAALDYRQWHVFAVERFQSGQWRSASGPSSGGEKVLSVSIPLFAAATSHYNSAGPYAPRLILLDEAFAGVDDDSRAKSLGLLATFDLDVVMTSEREWGCYPQVPGLAIAQLSRIDGIDAVGVTRWRWDGQRRERLGEVDDDARAGAGASDPDPDPSLFG